MKIKNIIVLIFLVFSFEAMIAQRHQIALGTSGAYFFDDNDYASNPGFSYQFYPSVSYQYQASKWGLQASIVNYRLYYDAAFSTTGQDIRISSRIGSVFNANILYKVRHWKTGQLNALLGVSTSLSRQDYNIHHPGERLSGDLALNFGFNFNQKIYKRFYFTSNLRSVNFLTDAKIQKNAIWFENGIGYRFGKK